MPRATILNVIRQTKIITTLGPATERSGELERVILSGANAVRLNFSHGTHQEHKQHILNVRELAEKYGIVVGVIADLQGPKIRIASFKEGKISLKEGQNFILDAQMDSQAGTPEAVGIDYKELPQDVHEGDTLLLDDGEVELTVLKVEGEKIHCRVDYGDSLSNHKGINRKGGGLSARALTDKDRDDLAFAVTMNVDYFALSFPRDKEDILEAKALIKKHGGHAGVIAKIERVEALKNIEEIIAVSDAIMVARGDLAVEIGDAQVPLAQKEIIERCRKANKPVITATQMMESMIHNMVPTRAEVSDVANAVFDNTDAVMLSAESAAGDHPHVVVEAMARTCIAAEKPSPYLHAFNLYEKELETTGEAIARASMYTANHLKVKAIICLTESGATPLLMSRIHTQIPIYGLSRSLETLGLMSIYKGVQPVLFDVTQYSYDDVNKAVVSKLLAMKKLDPNDRVILTKGDYMGVGGGTNMMKILVVGQVV